MPPKKDSAPDTNGDMKKTVSDLEARIASLESKDSDLHTFILKRLGIKDVPSPLDLSNLQAVKELRWVVAIIDELDIKKEDIINRYKKSGPFIESWRAAIDDAYGPGGGGELNDWAIRMINRMQALVTAACRMWHLLPAVGEIEEMFSNFDELNVLYTDCIDQLDDRLISQLEKKEKSGSSLLMYLTSKNFPQRKAAIIDSKLKSLLKK
jgi:hypothetical protein